MAFARGKHSKAISDRSGLEFPYTEMVKEWNGMFVHTSEYEPKQPQLDPKPKGSDPQGLLNARPARAETAVPRLLPLNPFTLTSGSQVIKVNEPNHGRSTSDRVRFRDAQNIANITPAIINLAIGYVITKTDDNNYTFDSGNTASKTISGGGGSAFAGPVTVVK
tara:strand:- start:329 stop:820 length:492 start_codon:yes stop_codon:yes gene_type:complete